MIAGNQLLDRGYSVRIFYRSKALSIKKKLGRFYRRLRYGPPHDWLTTFRGKSFEYSKLNPTVFSPSEIIVSMCAQTTLDMESLPSNVGLKVMYCRGVEIENWEKMLVAWKLPFPKLVTSSHIADLIRQEVDHKIIGIVPNGVDVKVYYPCVSEQERINIGAILGSGRPKDPETAMRVMQILKAKMPNVPRIMFGAWKPKHRIEAVFHRQPSVDEARRIYSSCKVWFLTSLQEGFGNPILEAMACGCAVVSTDCGGPGDIIENGVNGFLVEVGNTRAMVDKIMLLYKDDKLRKQICENAMKTVKKFSWPKAVDKLEGYLLSIYKNHYSSSYES